LSALPRPQDGPGGRSCVGGGSRFVRADVISDGNVQVAPVSRQLSQRPAVSGRRVRAFGDFDTHSTDVDTNMLWLWRRISGTAACQRNSFGTGQASKASSGRSAQPHQTCRPAHLHSDRQARRPSSSRLDSTKPPDSMGWPQSGQAGASLLMRRTLRERPLHPEATWSGAPPWACVPPTRGDGPWARLRLSPAVRWSCQAVRRSPTHEALS
jgi:hypothetical protein